MGCVSSSLHDGGQISDQLLELAPREPGSKDPLPLLTKTILLEALGHLSQYFADSHTEITTVIAVGGAVNTVHLGTRDATHDIDFL